MQFGFFNRRSAMQVYKPLRNASNILIYPLVKTAIPGPNSKKLIAELSNVQDERAVAFHADYSKSKGNYIVDADGNYLLDLFCQIASIAVGYNNQRLREMARSEQFVTMAINRPALGVMPPTDWYDLLEQSVGKVRPKGIHTYNCAGLDQIFTAMCGSCANEIAFKAAFMKYQRRMRGGDFDQLDLQSCMKNAKPGSPELAVMSFKGSFHGRLFGSLSATRSKAIHKVDIPAFSHWPAAPFPQLQYPLELFNKENAAEENRCLARATEIIDSNPVPVAAVIVEPIQAEGGDNHASPNFFKKLRNICLERDITFIVDEVQTGVCSTGTFWAHEQWELDTPPDIVTFSKKMQVAGFYHNMSLRPSHSYRNFNTWLGDPIRLLQNKAIIDEIEAKGLQNTVISTGKYLYSTLLNFQNGKAKGKISKVRGVGTFLAFDCASPATRDKLVSELRSRGVVVGGSGDKTIRFRPMLTLEKKHADVFASVFDSALDMI